MANLNITEFSGTPTKNGSNIDIAALPGLAVQSITYTSSTASAAFNAETRLIRVTVDADAWLVVAETPTATVATGTKLPSGAVEYFYVQPGDKIAAYDGTT